MASTTPYKDELIRIATLLGLPDDVDPTTVADAVQERLKGPLAQIAAMTGVSGAEPETVVKAVETAVNNAGLLRGVDAMRAHERSRADKFREGLEDAADVIERAQADLRGITGAQLLQSRATAQRLVGDLGLAHAAAETALEEPPAPPEVEEV